MEKTEFKNKIAEFFAEPLLDLGNDLLKDIYEPKKRKEIVIKSIEKKFKIFNARVSERASKS